ncbi:MAG: sialate O-acetylesterase [Verrucomicrobiota bacterium]
MTDPSLLRQGGSLLLALLLCAAPARADVALPAIFGTHMVLQQGQTLPVWGTAAPGEAVAVTLGAQTAKTTADSAGKWRIDLKPISAAQPLTLTVAGKNTLSFTDVLAGDVWVCSGQSNMEFPLHGAHDATTEIPKADEPQIRLFLVTKKTALQPQTDVKAAWVVCSPATVGNFSAVGYFFGRTLQHELHRPIGLIGTYWGGTPAQAWTSLAGLQQPPPFAHYVEQYQSVLSAYPDNLAKYPALAAAYQQDLKQWNDTVGKTYQPVLAQWSADVAKAQAAGQPAPPKPAPSTLQPKAPAPPEGGPNTPTVLYNGMIAPLVPFAIKGAIWYQGESNAGNGPEYATLFPRMITTWRTAWGEGDFPFLFVQLANFMKPQEKPSEGGWALLREAQFKTLALPKTGMAVIIDIGDGGNIHPKDKHDVGERLALVARHVAYGEKLVSSGPLYDAMKVEGHAIRLSFTHTGSGLKIGAAPWSPTGPPPAVGSELTGFAIAGADKNWAWAKAKIEGDDVIVSSDQVPSPVAVRYGWANNPPCNLYNKEDLPASPFRTDTWTDAPPKPMASAAPATPSAPAPVPPKP